MGKQYSEYKIDKRLWNSKFPAHWDIKPVYGIGKVKSICNCTDRQLLSVYLDVGVIPFLAKTEKRTNTTSKDLSKYQRVDCGDLVLNNQQAWRGSVGVSDYEGIISPAYIIVSLDDSLIRKFANYVFRSRIMVDQYVINSKGVGSIQRNIYWQSLKRTLVPIPPRYEQEKIVLYLDWQVSKINKFIESTKKKIDLLREYRKATIDEGILHGFGANEKKESGIYWLEEIPRNWEVLPIKRICKVNASISEKAKKQADDELVTFLPMENVTTNGEVDCSIKKPIKEVRSGYSSFARGDVVVAKITPCFENGKGACLDCLDTEIGYGTTEFINLRPSDKVLAKYLYLITMTQPFRKLGEKVMSGSAGQKRVPVEFIKNFALGIPSVKEQKKIIKNLEEKLHNIDNLIEKEKAKIDTVHELKNRLISDIVTGKLDVRNVEIPEYEYMEESSYLDEEIEVEEANEEM